MLRKPVAESDLGERLSRDRAELGQNILLACRALGFGAVLTTNHMLLQHEMKQILGLDAGVMTFGLIPIGYPTGTFVSVNELQLASAREVDAIQFSGFLRGGTLYKIAARFCTPRLCSFEFRSMFPILYGMGPAHLNDRFQAECILACMRSIRIFWLR